MRKPRFTALLLAAMLTLFSAAPATAYAAETSETTAAESVDSTTTPYILKTKQVSEYDANTVEVWLELDPSKAESVASYQIALQLMSDEGSAVAGRGMELTFDKALDGAKIKKANFNSDTQIMQIYVAGSENLVQIINDGGSTVNKLPIGTLKVDKLEGEDNPFKIVLSGNTGDLTTVDLNMDSVNAADTYGVDFEIPVDGAVYGEPVQFPLGIKVEGRGTVNAYVVKDDGEEAVDGKVYENAKVRLVATPDYGYRLTSIKLIDNLDETHEVDFGGDFKFTMKSVIGVTATFERMTETFTVTVDENGSIVGTSDNKATYESRLVASVVAEAPAGKKFSHWVNSDGDVVSNKATYSFVVVSNVTLTPVFVDEDKEKEEIASVALDAAGTVSPLNGKYRLSYSGTCFVPKGCKLVERGIILTNQRISDSNINSFVIGGKINNVNVATCAVSGTNNQFVANVNNVAKGGQIRTARSYMTYMDSNGDTKTVYSTNAVELTTP